MKKRTTQEVILTYCFIPVMAFMGYWVRLFVLPDLADEENRFIAYCSVFFIAFTWESLRYLNRTLNKYLPFEEVLIPRIALQLFSGMLLMLFLRYLMMDVFRPKYVRSVQINETFQLTTYVIYLFLSVIFNFAFFAEHFFQRWKQSLQVAQKLEKEKAVVQFDNLRNQLNPHFLFNALSSLNSLIFEDQALASRFLQQLSRIYRYVLQHKDTETVTLKTEVDFIMHYVNLLQIRFGEALQINIHIDEDAMHKGIVPVTLQALLENALKHNIVNQKKPLTISISSSGDQLIIRNNLQRKSNVESSNKQGLQNLKTLYSFLSSKPVEVLETSDTFEIKIPLIT